MLLFINELLENGEIKWILISPFTRSIGFVSFFSWDSNITSKKFEKDPSRGFLVNYQCVSEGFLRELLVILIILVYYLFL